MYGKFDKYWSDYSVILSLAVILDPRYKIQFVEFCYTKLYGPGSIEGMRIREKLFSLFNLYTINVPPRPHCSSSNNSSSLSEMATGSSWSSSTYSRDCMDVLKVDLLICVGIMFMWWYMYILMILLVIELVHILVIDCSGTCYLFVHYWTELVQYFQHKNIKA